MIDESKPEDKGIAAALIERFEKWILPHALEIKAKKRPRRKAGRLRHRLP